MTIWFVNENETSEFVIARSKTGIPCVWEEGGSFTNTGHAVIVGNAYGNPKRAIYIRTNGDLCCKEHALIPIRENDSLMFASRQRDEVIIRNFFIEEIAEDYATICTCDSFNYDMLQSAIDKVYAYHCRTPMYILRDDGNDNENSYTDTCQMERDDDDDDCVDLDEDESY